MTASKSVDFGHKKYHKEENVDISERNVRGNRRYDIKMLWVVWDKLLSI